MNPPDLSRLQSLQIDSLLTGATLDSMRPRFATLRDRHDNGTAPRAVSAFQLFQTPPEVAAQLVRLLNPSEGARILEPSAGLGRILDALTPRRPSEVVAVEHAPNLAAELYAQERTGVRLVQRDFLTTTPAELGAFDFIAMNPPFHMRADIRHISHALQFLRKGGRLAALCMDTPHRAEAFRRKAVEWISLPAGTFKHEGTSVPTVLFLITA